MGRRLGGQNRFHKYPLGSKKAAYRMAHAALRIGRIERKPCEICGNRAEMHHEDYNKPLEIMWLCRKHHLARHGVIVKDVAQKPHLGPKIDIQRLRQVSRGGVGVITPGGIPPLGSFQR